MNDVPTGRFPKKEELKPFESLDPSDALSVIENSSPDEQRIIRKALEAAEKNKNKKAIKRNLNKFETVFHDLFQLEVTETLKNEAPYDPTLGPDKQSHSPQWREVKHKHFFHTCDSDGKKFKYSAPSAGHFHEVQVFEDEDGGLRAECGPPMVMHLGKPHPYRNDKHKHEVSYVESEEIAKRVRSGAAATSMALLSQEENKVRKEAASFVKES